MAAPLRPAPDSLIALLCDDPHRFEFFAAVRALHALRDPNEATAPPRVGADDAPQSEPVRFRVRNSTAFPPSALHALDAETRTMIVSFLGLNGPCGVLPPHMAMLLLDLQRQGDGTLAAFLDLFNHRLISHFYRAWEKNRYPIEYERVRRSGGDIRRVAFVRTLFSLVGLRPESLSSRAAFDDESLLYYSGHFARSVRSATALEQMLCDLFRVPARVESLAGRWLRVSESLRLRFDARRGGGPLGLNGVLGEMVWDIQGHFRVRLGPLDWAEYRSFLPDGEKLQKLAHLVRMFVGPELDFEVVLMLRRDHAPECRMGEGENGARLGWTSLVRSTTPSDDIEGARFEFDQIHPNAAVPAE